MAPSRDISQFHEGLQFRTCGYSDLASPEIAVVPCNLPTEQDVFDLRPSGDVMHDHVPPARRRFLVHHDSHVRHVYGQKTPLDSARAGDRYSRRCAPQAIATSGGMQRNVPPCLRVLLFADRHLQPDTRGLSRRCKRRYLTARRLPGRESSHRPGHIVLRDAISPPQLRPASSRTPVAPPNPLTLLECGQSMPVTPARAQRESPGSIRSIPFFAENSACLKS